MTKILYVDDDDDIREIALISLELEPAFEVRGCDSGANALRIVEEWQPDIVLLDVMMPGMDGPSTLVAMQSSLEGPLPVVVFCTARAQVRDLEHYLALGAAGVISKPFDPMSLASETKAFLG